jgi:hypothetical protein
MQQSPRRHAELVSASIDPASAVYADKWTLRQVQGDEGAFLRKS